MKNKMKKTIQTFLCFLITGVLLSCGNIAFDDSNIMPASGTDIVFNFSLGNQLPRSAVPQALNENVFYQLIVSDSTGLHKVESELQKTLSFSIPSPGWTGSSVARLKMFCPTSSQLDNGKVKTSELANLAVCMEGEKSFTLNSGTRIFNFSIDLNLNTTGTGSISLPVTVGTSACTFCYIVRNSVSDDPTKYIEATISSGKMTATGISPFSEMVTFYFFVTKPASPVLTDAVVVYSDSLTVMSGTKTQTWVFGNSANTDLDLDSLRYTTFYVDGTNGNDSYSGSSYKPVKTVSAAINLCTDSATAGQVGGTIYLKNSPADTGAIQVSKSVKIAKTQNAGTITFTKGISVSADKTLELESINVSNAGLNNTAIELANRAKLRIKNATVSNCANGIKGGNAVEVDLQTGAFVTGCTGTGLTVESSSVLKIQGTAVTDGTSSDLDFITGNKIDIHNKAGNYIRVNKDSYTDETGSVLKNLLEFDTAEETRTVYLGKSTDSTVTWNLKSGVSDLNRGSSATQVYTLSPTKSDGRITIQRDASCQSDNTFSLIRYNNSLGAGGLGKRVFTNITFKNGLNNGAYNSEGGALYLKEGTTDFNNCQFINNKAVDGGALAIKGNTTTVNLTGCTFGGDNSSDGNSAEENGGAVYCEGKLNILSTGNTFKNNKACTVQQTSGTCGGGAIFLFSSGICEMSGGLIESNSIVQPSSGTGEIVGGSIAVQGTAIFKFLGGQIKNGSFPATGDVTKRFGQDIYIEEGVFYLSDSTTDAIVSNTANPGIAGEIYIYRDGVGGFCDQSANMISGNDAILNKITLANESGDVGGICVIRDGENCFIRVNSPKNSAFYKALEKTSSLNSYATIYVGKNGDTDTVYDCGTSSDTITCNNTRSFGYPFTVTPTSSGNTVLIKASLTLQKNSFEFKDCKITGTDTEIYFNNADTGKALTFDNTTVTGCKGVTLNGGTRLVYKNNTVISDNTCPISLQNGAKIRIDSTVPVLCNNDYFKGYLGYIKLLTDDSLYDKTDFFFTGSEGNISRFCFLPPGSQKYAYYLNGDNNVVKLAPQADNNPMLYYILTETVPEASKTVTIENQFELEQLAKWVNANSSEVLEKVTFKLINDIELHGKWTPIGKSNGTDDSGAFGGVFDGNNFTISGLDVDYDSDKGVFFPALFQKIQGGSGNSEDNKNAIVQKLTVSGKSQCAGIVGYSVRGYIINCKNKVVVTTPQVWESPAAGICAKVTSTEIRNCSNEADISGTNAVGGIVGTSDGGSSPSPIYICSNTGHISGTTNVGGIAGYFACAINTCINEGSVTATGNFAGGIAGSFNGRSSSDRSTLRNIMNVWNQGSVTAGNYAGGIVGKIGTSNTSSLEYFEVLNAAHETGKIIVTDTSDKKAGYIYGGMDYTTDPNCLADGLLYYKTVAGSSVINNAWSGTGIYSYKTTDLNGDGTVNASDTSKPHNAILTTDNVSTKLNEWANIAKNTAKYNKYPPSNWQ